MAVRPDGKIVYVACETDGYIYPVDIDPLSVVARIPVGGRPRSIAFLRISDRALITLENEAAIAVVDSSEHRSMRS